MASSDLADFQVVTEMPGEPVSQIQIDRLLSRYAWAAAYCHDLDVVEAGCGAGPGLGLIGQVAASLEAGDISEPVLAQAIRHYGDRFPLSIFDAQQMPFADGSKDVIILFEALYYLPNPVEFVCECKRVLRRGGRVLIATANRNLWDFHPSAFSIEYYGVIELKDLFENQEFSTDFFGFEIVNQLSVRQKLLRPVKRLAVAIGLMPKTMAGKQWLKRIVFGPPVNMPSELEASEREIACPTKLSKTYPDTEHKVIYCAATLQP